MALALLMGSLGVLLAFLIADFAERVRRLAYESRDRPVPDSRFKRYVMIGFSAFFIAWSAVAYL